MLSGLISLLQLIFDYLNFKLGMENREGASKIKIIWASDYLNFESDESREMRFIAMKGVKKIKKNNR